MQLVPINKIKPKPNNPRILKDDKYKKLVKSLQDFPDMLNKRPLVCFTDVDGNYVVLGGNMRLKALKELKYKEVPIILADEWTEEQKNEFVIKDNVGFGEWDWDVLSNEWDSEQLEEWGLDVPSFEEKEIGQKKTEELKPYKKTHILLSFEPQKIDDLKIHLDKILEIDGIEYEQSSN